MYEDRCENHSNVKIIVLIFFLALLGVVVRLGHVNCGRMMENGDNNNNNNNDEFLVFFSVIANVRRKVNIAFGSCA